MTGSHASAALRPGKRLRKPSCRCSRLVAKASADLTCLQAYCWLTLVEILLLLVVQPLRVLALMSSKEAVTVVFELVGDQFHHAWFFNRFRVERIGKSYFVNLALSTESGGVLAVNGFVLSESDHHVNRERCQKYIAELSDTPSDKSCILSLSPPPARVYPVNYINLARTGQMAEIGLFRFSVHSLADAMRKTREGSPAKASNPVKCYPVVMFRCDLGVQITLLKELFSI